MKSNCICLIGIDGVGKTTHSIRLKRSLRAKGQRSIHVYLRRPYLLSLPLLAYARMNGFTKYRTMNGIRYGHREFHKSRLLSAFFPLTLLMDSALFTAVKLRLPLLLGFTVVCDRCACDTLVDLMLSLGDDRYFERPLGRLFLSLLPSKSAILLLDHNDVEILRQRRRDLAADDTLQRRRELYLALAESLNIPVIGTEQPIADTWKELARLTGMSR